LICWRIDQKYNHLITHFVWVFSTTLSVFELIIKEMIHGEVNGAFGNLFRTTQLPLVISHIRHTLDHLIHSERIVSMPNAVLLDYTGVAGYDSLNYIIT
jgi:hypothetical protein